MADRNNENATKEAKPNASIANPIPPLRVLVASQVGSVGKSMVAANVLVPRLGCDYVYSVEATNSDASQYGVPVQEYAADELSDLRLDVSTDPMPAVIDLGASDFTAFVDELNNDDLLKTFTHCILVAGPEPKEQQELITTYQTFRHFGMDPRKFRVVLNRVKRRKRATTVEQMDGVVIDQFPMLFAYAKSNPEFWVKPRCYLPDLGAALRRVRDCRTSFGKVLADKTDYEALNLELLSAGDEVGSVEAAKLMMCGDAVRLANIFLENAFEALALRPSTV